MPLLTLHEKLPNLINESILNAVNLK